ncbi:MAG TPA: hypothetical protein VKW78_00510 [Terriglobales bacterium]|nr:hypothetical protein [Terriglobales bacterium]
MGIAICVVTLILTYYAGRRSLVAGVMVMVTAGYAYGIVRANLDSPAAYFLFDSAVLGLYAAQFPSMTRSFASPDGRRLKHWILLLALWPLILFFIPLQDPLVQAVGLRGSIFFLPMVLLGARLTREKLHTLALCLAALNLVAVILGFCEYFFGVDSFYPRNVVTELIYNSNDVGPLGAYRIPCSFANAHAYGGTMVMTLPLLLGAWVQRDNKRMQQILLVLGIVSAVLGVLLSATRTHFAVMIVLLGIFILSSRVRPGVKLAFTTALIAVTLIVAQQDRLQRFTTLHNTRYVESRVHDSVNGTFLEALQMFPFGNGLGGGGTSIPAFLQDRVHAPLLLESEYGRTLLETGIIGLALWTAFFLWFATRHRFIPTEPWAVGRRIAWYACIGTFIQGLLGIGMFLSIPQSVLFLMMLGWVSIPQNDQPDYRMIPLQRARLLNAEVRRFA